MTRDSKVQLGAAIVMCLALLTSGSLAVQLSGIAGRAKLTYADRAEDSQSWEVAMGIAMGAFRGIFVNFLWIRANDLKEAGKFYEAIELAKAITKLQPRFPRVWVFHAWNLAYNVSVSTQTPQERWQWVNDGIRLLRDQGIPANPNEMLLHKELGWIFLHKIGGYTDDANAYYKRELAKEWTFVLGPPPVRELADKDNNHAIEKYASWLQVVADAPTSFDALVAREPSVQVLVQRLRDALGSDLDLAFLKRYELMKAVERSSRRAVYEWQIFNTDKNPKTRAFYEICRDPAMQKALDAAIPFTRRKVLVETYHMEPERMIRYTRKYGPMDWRHHGAHALYWAAKGVEAGLTRFHVQAKRDYDFINTDRVVFQAVQDIFRSGEIYYDFLSDSTGQYSTMLGAPNLNFADTYGKIIEELRARSWADQQNRIFSVYSAGYENFVRDLVTFFYRRGEIPEAEKWYQHLRTWEGQNLNLGQLRVEDVSMPLKDFVDKELNDRFTSPYIAVQQVTGALTGAFTAGLLSGNDQLFFSQFAYARDVHANFMKEQRRLTAAGSQYARMDQMEPDFRLLAGQAFMQFISTLSLEDAEKVYDRAPNDLKQFAYQMLKSSFAERIDAEARQAGSGSRTFDQMFPEPRDYAQFLADLRIELEKRQKKADSVELK